VFQLRFSLRECDWLPLPLCEFSKQQALLVQLAILEIFCQHWTSFDWRNIIITIWREKSKH